MKLPLNFIADYVDIDGIKPSELLHEMTMSGTQVSGYTCLAEMISNVYTGKILEVTKHPQADKLNICKCVCRGKDVQIVTGADNVRDGDIVPIALDGAKLPTKTIKAGKLRGEVSDGMLCSEDELFPDRERADGIMILPKDTPLDVDIRDHFNMWDSVIEFDIMPNRSDCLSVRGIARELAATYKREFKQLPNKYTTIDENIDGKITVEIQNYDLCPRYTARMVRNVKIAPSPQWMQQRLKDSGIKAINNIVDITNYVMLEYGQPLHAFDLRFVDKGIVVRNASENEEIVALDGEKYTLNPNMLVIADKSKPLAIAGVMGGEFSGIKDDTTDILFESANFNYANIRVTSKKLGLRSESSARFEKGVDIYSTTKALDRVCSLICELGIGEVLAGEIDNCKGLPENTKIPFEYERVNALLGTNLSKDEMAEILARIEVQLQDNNLVVPTHRGDLTGIHDIAEEIARFHGYDNIASTLPSGVLAKVDYPIEYTVRDISRRVFSALGMNEIVTYSWFTPKALDTIGVPEDSPLRDTIMLINPQGEESSAMRTTALPHMLTVLSHNYSVQNENASLYELATTYHKGSGGKVDGYIERGSIIIGRYGEDADFFAVKLALEELLSALGIPKYDIEPLTDNAAYHSGQAALVSVRKKPLAKLGTLHPTVAARYRLPKTVVAEIDFQLLVECYKADKKFEPIARFPKATRDFAVVVSKDVTAAQIENIIQKQKSDIIESYRLFDVYEGKQLGDNVKSIAYTITFRDKTKTLNDADINAVMQSIISGLEKQLNAKLRS